MADAFIDSSAEAGIDFIHSNGMSGQYYFHEMMGAGAALFDFDNDGDLDLYLVQGSRLEGDPAGVGADRSVAGEESLGDRLYRNDLEAGETGGGGPRFVDVTETSGIRGVGYGMGVASGDFNNDGWLDLYVTNFGSNSLLRNDGDGTFSDVTASSGSDDNRWSVAALFFDLDRDGWLDLFVGNYVDFTLATHKRCTSDLGLSTYCGPLSYNPQPDRLLRNLGDSTFADVTGRSGLSSALGGALGAVNLDVDGDGWLDLYVANDGLPNQLWVNQGDGTFRDLSLLSGSSVNEDGNAEASMGVSAADFDRDGDEDLFLTHLARETNTLYVNDGEGFFEDHSKESGLAVPSLELTGFGVSWLDFDNDGWLDLVAVNGAVKTIAALALAGDPFPLHQPNQLFHNQKDLRFHEVGAGTGSPFALSEVSRGAAFGDVDNDGDLDVVVTNNNGPARLLLNRVGQDGHWVGLRLLERHGRRDALGAWVGVFAGDGPPLWRRVSTGGSYASASDPRVVVGLGAAERLDRIEVLWPDGGREEWTEVAADRYSVLQQGTGRGLARP